MTLVLPHNEPDSLTLRQDLLHGPAAEAKTEQVANTTQPAVGQLLVLVSPG